MIVLGYSGYTRDLRSPDAVGSPMAKTALTFDNLFRFRAGEAPLSLFPLGFFGHDAAAALVRDGEVIACAAEERFTRVKHGLNLAGNTLLPRRAVQFCLDEGGVDLDEVDVVAHYCDFTEDRVRERLDLLRPHVSPETATDLEQAFRRVYETMLCPAAVRAQFARMTGCEARALQAVPHHLAHAASSYFASGFEESLILTLDGTGEVESSLLAVGEGADIEPLRTTHVPTSLGTLYLLMTVYLGFRSLGDEGKVMGLAPYGDPAPYRPFFDSLVGTQADGAYATERLTDPDLPREIVDAFGPAREPGAPLEPCHADVAASLQEAVERAVLETLLHARRETGLRRLCLAGGVALNCTLNGKIASSGLFDDVFVQPAAGDEGGSVGAALWACHAVSHPDRPAQRWRHAAWGPAHADASIERALGSHGDRLRWRPVDDIASVAAERVSEGAVVGWFQGRMEFGPRALGGRSILADARDPGTQDRLNQRVKHREAFRPFAPAVLEEEAGQWFDMQGLSASPFMLFAVPVRPSKRDQIPAVTHVDGTARVQTVSRDVDPLFWSLIHHLGKRTGVPVVVNTSFNVQGEPIVCSPEDAIRCFLGTGIDCLAIGSYLVEKESVT